MRILVVDNEAPIRKLARLMAEQAGFEVEEAADGALALRSIRARTPDLVLCDLFMPEPDGLEVIRESRREFPAVPFIAMSGGGRRSNMDMLSAARLLGAAATLAKPFCRQELLTAIRVAIGLVSPVPPTNKLPA